MAIYNGRILMRKGNEADFDASKLMSGEWAVSLDAGIVRICLEAGKVIRMATYEAFEEDMKQIEAILLECQSIEEAVRRINTEVSEKLNACAEYVQQAKNYSEQAKTSEANAKSYMQSASTSVTNAKTSENNAKTSELNAKASENNAKLSEESAREVFESIPEDYSTISNDLYELAIKETASGEEIHVNDSSNLKLREFALYGKAKQNTTTGKNLLPYPYNESTHTENGITFTDNGDGTITANGTATANAAFELNTRFTLPDGDYVLSGCPSGGSKETYSIYIQNYDFSEGALNNRDNEVSFARSFFTKDIRARIWILSGVKVENLVFKPMIRLAGTDDTWEQPTNGATPRPDYPQSIEVSGESYNLLENTATSQTISGVEFVVNEDKSITVSGTATESAYFDIGKLIPELGQTYILDGLKSVGSNATYFLYWNTNGGTVEDMGTGKTTTITDNTTRNNKVQIVVRSGVKADFTVYPMIRKASVKRNKYMPYGVDRVEVKSVGEQLFDGVLELGRLANDTGNVMETTSAIRSANYIEVTGGDTITISNDKGYANYVYEYNAYKEYLGYSPSDSTHTLTLKPNTKYIKFRTKETGSQNDLSTKFMINSGLEALPYEPYKETLSTIPTENGLAGIKVSSDGNYTDQNGQQWICDEIVKFADGSGEKIQRVKNYKVTNASNVTSYKALGNHARCGINESDMNATNNPMKMNGLSNILLYEADYSIDKPHFYADKITIYVFVPINELETQDANGVKKWLISKNAEFMYVLETPIHTPLTAEEIAEIEKLHTFYPITNISNDFDCGMKVTYYCDSKNYIDKKISELATAMLSNI